MTTTIYLKLSLKRDWKLYLNGNANGAFYYTGTGYVSSLAPTVAPENPVWISPMSIAVDGAITSGVV